jgi:hypothetical protein
MANLRVRLLAAATVHGKRSYYKPAMRSTGWPDPAAVLVNERKVRITPTQLHSYYVTWLEGKKQKWENVGSDALTAWQCKLNREAIMNGAEGAEEQKVKHNGNRVTVADAIEVFLEDVKAGKSPKTHQARKRMLDLFTESCSKQYLDQVNEADSQQFIRFLRKRYKSAKGARTVYNVFQGFNTFLRANKIFIAGQLLKGSRIEECGTSCNDTARSPGAAAAFEASGDDPLAFLIKHVSLDPGDLNAHDIRENQLRLEQGFRILSAYRLSDQTRVWIITEADRSVTITFLLPNEY